MAEYTQKYNVLTGQRKSNKFVFGRNHIGTTDFFKPNVLGIQELVPGDKFKVNVSSFLRGKPLALPTMGSISQNVHAFFVPMRTIHSHWNDFITETPYQRFTNTGTSSVFISPQTKVWQKLPSFNNADLIKFILTGNWSLYYSNSGNSKVYPSDYSSWYYLLSTYDSTQIRNTIINSSSSGVPSSVPFISTSSADIVTQDNPITDASFDFRFHIKVDSSSKYLGFKLTNRGRTAIQILESLGYSFSRYVQVDYASQGNRPTANDSVTGYTYSFLPLLAYCKVVCDYFVPSSFYTDYVTRLEYFGMLDNPMSFLPNQAPFPFADIIGYISYDPDYFTSAWSNPTGPSSSVDGQEFEIRTPLDITDITDTNTFDSTNRVYMNTNSNKITLQALNMLKSLQSWAVRNNVAGYRAIDRMFTQFGVNLNNIQSNRSVYLSGKNSPFVVSDVTNVTALDSGADSLTDTEVLGGYAGKVATQSGLSFDFSTDEFGYIIILQTIIPKIGYVQGSPRDVHRVDALDFFQPSFDNKGVDAIAAGELIVSDASQNSTQLSQGSVFGFCPRYASYKMNTYDRLTGDFVLSSKNTGLEAFDLFRRVPWNTGRISLDFIKGEQEQYDRIFNYTKDDYDHFYFNCQIDMVAHRNMISCSDALLIDEDDHTESGKKAHMNSGGQYIN